MPRKAYRKKAQPRRRPRKTYRKKKPFTGVRVNRVKEIAGFADKAMVRLPYDTYATMTSANSYLQFKLNSVYDPYSTSVGCTITPENVQPAGFDRYAGIYAKYRVSACKVELWFQNYAAINSMPARLLVYGTDSSGVPNTFTRAVMPNSYAGLLPSASSGKPTYVKRYYTMARLSGKSKAQVQGSDQFLATVSADPSDGSYLIVQSVSVDETTAQSTAVRVRLTYYVTFEDPIFDITDD